MAGNRLRFKRTEPHGCQQCGLCCKGRGDLAFGCDSVAGDADCPALEFNGKVAQCSIYKDRREFCREYPRDELCGRELKEAGLAGKNI